MAIKVIKQPDVYLTASQLARYREEFRTAFTGPRPDFEEWVAARERIKKDGKRLGQYQSGEV